MHSVFSHFMNLTSHRLCYRDSKPFLYKLKGYYGYNIYLYFIHLSKNKVYYPQISFDNEEWAISWTQLDFLLCEIVSFIISIGQGLLARWQGLTFIFIGNGQVLLARSCKSTFRILAELMTKN